MTLKQIKKMNKRDDSLEKRERKRKDVLIGIIKSQGVCLRVDCRKCQFYDETPKNSRYMCRMSQDYERETNGNNWEYFYVYREERAKEIYIQNYGEDSLVEELL